MNFEREQSKNKISRKPKTCGFSDSLKQTYISSMYKFCVFFGRIRLECKTTNLLAFSTAVYYSLSTEVFIWSLK
jgi:hypothetical protein